MFFITQSLYKAFTYSIRRSLLNLVTTGWRYITRNTNVLFLYTYLLKYYSLNNKPCFFLIS